MTQDSSDGESLLVHPQPSIYETTVATVDDEDSPAGVREIDHVWVERVLSRPKWDYRSVNLEVMRKITNQRTRGLIVSRGADPESGLEVV
jgi:hypothetical protein